MSIYWARSFKFKHKSNISLGWKRKKHMPSLKVRLFRNSTNLAKVNIPKINQNALIKKRNKLLKNSKFLLKRLQMFYIFWTKVSTSK